MPNAVLRTRPWVKSKIVICSDQDIVNVHFPPFRSSVVVVKLQSERVELKGRRIEVGYLVDLDLLCVVGKTLIAPAHHSVEILR